jgi:hypothetical protein
MPYRVSVNDWWGYTFREDSMYSKWGALRFRMPGSKGDHASYRKAEAMAWRYLRQHTLDTANARLVMMGLTYQDVCEAWSDAEFLVTKP